MALRINKRRESFREDTEKNNFYFSGRITMLRVPPAAPPPSPPHHMFFRPSEKYCLRRAQKKIVISKIELKKQDEHHSLNMIKYSLPSDF